MCSQAVGTTAGGVQRGVGLVVRDQQDGWSIESTRFHGMNVVSCEIMSCGQHTPLIGAYLSLPTLDNLLDLEESLGRFPEKDSIVIGDLNADIGRLQKS